MAAMGITYRYPAAVAGGAVPPTVLQGQANEVVVDVAAGAGTEDATPVIHNMGLNATGADGSPRVSAQILAAAAAVQPIITVVDGNTILVTSSNAGVFFTVRLHIERPHSITQ
jgi:hypothetical protein